MTVACAAVAIAPVAIRLMITLGENQRLARDNQTILSTAGEGILRTDSQGRITYANPAACEMLGYDARELIGPERVTSSSTTRVPTARPTRPRTARSRP